MLERKKEMETLAKKGDIKAFRRLISAQKMVIDNVKKYDGTTYYGLELNVKHLEGKAVKAGEKYLTISKGTHISFYHRNIYPPRPQPYGCGYEVNLKEVYEFISEVDGVIHIFDDMLAINSCCIGVIAHKNDSIEDLKKWFVENCF